jgi:hypothetical protein
MIEIIGWASSIILVATIAKQIYKLDMALRRAARGVGRLHDLQPARAQLGLRRHERDHGPERPPRIRHHRSAETPRRVNRDKRRA